jgi:hypothetical protein
MRALTRRRRRRRTALRRRGMRPLALLAHAASKR